MIGSKKVLCGVVFVYALFPKNRMIDAIYAPVEVFLLYMMTLCESLLFGEYIVVGWGSFFQYVFSYRVSTVVYSSVLFLMSCGSHVLDKLYYCSSLLSSFKVDLNS